MRSQIPLKKAHPLTVKTFNRSKILLEYQYSPYGKGNGAHSLSIHNSIRASVAEDLVKRPELLATIVQRLKAVGKLAEPANVVIGIEISVSSALSVVLKKAQNENRYEGRLRRRSSSPKSVNGPPLGGLN